MTEPTLRTSEEMLDRMEALARKIASFVDDKGVPLGSYLHSDALDIGKEAHAIVAMLPEPVDADIQMARDIAAATCADDGANSEFCEYIRAGRLDTQREFKVALVALKRGRELASA